MGTCMEMADSEQSSSCASGPEELVRQVAGAAHSKGIDLNGENALPRYDTTAYQKIESYKGQTHAFTYLRAWKELLTGDNFNRFKDFVNSMHLGASATVVV